MMIAFGYIGYNRNEFYDLSVSEWECAIKGCIKKQGGKVDSDYMSNDDLFNLMEQFPDD